MINGLIFFYTVHFLPMSMKTKPEINSHERALKEVNTVSVVKSIKCNK